MLLENAKIAVIGLGYVGLPLAVEFGKKRKTLGFEINQSRVDELNNNQDATLECSPEELKEATYLSYTTDVEELKSCNVFIVTVPTPINEHKQPDLTPLEKASEMLGGVISKGDVVIYESTVYPGCTEEICVNFIEAQSGLKFNEDFFVGYSPERINPGDKEHRLTTIKKVTSGSNTECAEFVDSLYNEIIDAGTHLAPSIKVAEASKVIENTQRDLNIALINELAIIFNRLDIDSLDVLEAAGTKWNFLPFRPGLVGGHCIGVDPYYLIHKSEAVGHHPDVIVAGRRINDGMSAFIVSDIVKRMNNKNILANGSNVLILGLTFKENCPDLRNSRVCELITEFQKYGISTDVHDPWADAAEAKNEYQLDLIEEPKQNNYDAIVLAVAHDKFLKLSASEIHSLGKENHLIYDIKSVLPKELVDARL
ncbi:Vi polysaccharide biosynthesis UDP-N-acetylglucosamine C-6 dehydrogenase TviB [Emcibacteraceae bacterium]|nr:Vi polysaccharide biosynthesis UDP-N-acetylglucosamine C-6 dehydrogenase TviB [Emcibacteraceae bacterium]